MSVLMFVLPFALTNHLSIYLLKTLRKNHLNWVFKAFSEDLIHQHYHLHYGVIVGDKNQENGFFQPVHFLYYRIIVIL